MPDPGSDAGGSAWRCDGVLFDYGGTLVDFEYPTAGLLEVVRAFRPRIEAELGSAAPGAETILREVLIPLEAYVTSLSEDEVRYLDVYRDAWHTAGLRLDDALLYEILDAEQRCWEQAVRLEPGALETLAWLGSHGIKRGLCSNAPFPAELLRRQLVGNGILPLLDGAVFSSEVGRRKPAPEVYRAALAAIGCAPQHTLFVGNRVREDFDGPTALGMRAVVVAAGAQEPVPPGIPVIASLSDLVAFI
jgi:putative hydrolase of the HAD superfamily